MESPILRHLAELHRALSGLGQGEVATYIPELAKADPDAFGICLVTMDGVAYEVGDTAQPFTIQSVSKPFVFATALADRGSAYVRHRLGVEPSGDAFNSISLDPRTGAPRNPMINAGAIAATGLLAGSSPAAQWQRIRASLSTFAGRELDVDEAVCESESATGFRNRAIAWMLKNSGIVEGDPMEVLENYFLQCSLLVTCRDLAFMAATLANGGVHPATGQEAVPAEHVEHVLSVMATCGMYDYAGSWMYEVGMPAKSGVSGGIIAVVPGRFGIGVYSPRLDDKGNSVRGIAACRRLSQEFDLHAFARTGSPAMALGRVYSAAAAPSRRQHPRETRDLLDARRDSIRYLCLHGFVGIDGAEYVIRRMQAMAPQSSAFILDLHHVTAISGTAARLLAEARLGFHDDGIAIVCSRAHGRRAILDPLGHAVRKDDRGFLLFEDNDLAAEWCENRLVLQAGQAPVSARTIADSVLFRDVPADLLRKVDGIAATRTFARGDEILHCGQAGDGRVFFIESGYVGIVVPLESGASQRIASLGPGMEFGEMALLGQTARSASVFAETDVRCRVVDTKDFDALARAAPELRIAVLENLARDVAGKLRGANEWIAALG